MAIEFTNKPIKWTNEGTAPSEDLKTNGFQAGYKPPAAVFNNQWHTTGECIEELQTKVSGVDDKKVDKAEGKTLSTNDYTDNDKAKLDLLSKYGDAITLGGIPESGYPPHYICLKPYGEPDSNMACIDIGNESNTTRYSFKGISCLNPSNAFEVSGTEISCIGHKLSEKLDVADFNAKAVTKDSSTNMGINGELIFPHPLGGSTNYVKMDGDSGVVAHYENSDDISEEIRPDITLIQGSKTHKLSEKANVSDLPIKSLEGQTVKPTSGTSVTAAEGATIIGDLRNRKFAVSSGRSSQGNVASGQYAIAMGAYTTASGNNSLAGGQESVASGNNSVAIGYCNTASEGASIAFGHTNDATGFASFTIGNANDAFGSCSVAAGTGNTALGYQFKIGCYGKAGTAGTGGGTIGDAFAIGNGTFSNLSNAFRVTYAGKAYGLASYSSSGADYAEYFEWKDGNPNNEDRRGKLVTLDGEKIRFATADDDYILGVVSANPCIEGDVYSDDWQGKYLTDVFGQRLTQTVHIPARYEEQEITDPETGETTTENVLIEDEHDAVQWVLNPDYDPEQEYVSREDRKEWTSIGLMGKLVVIDDGTCEVNGYCKAGVNGIATKADDGYRVMARIDDTHIRVLVR